jgi:hypothetical protein
MPKVNLTEHDTTILREAKASLERLAEMIGPTGFYPINLANQIQGILDKAEQTKTATPELIELARQQYQQEGYVEIDDNAEVSEGKDQGVYVQAWVWVGKGEE